MSTIYFAIAAAAVPTLMVIFVVMPMMDKLTAALQTLPL